MWQTSEHNPKRPSRFFSIGLSHDNLVNHYETNFSLMEHHQYSLTELNEMIPWEREVYLTLLIRHLKEKEQRMKQRGF